MDDFMKSPLVDLKHTTSSVQLYGPVSYLSFQSTVDYCRARVIALISCYIHHMCDVLQKIFYKNHIFQNNLLNNE